jgi:hypothetical protein
MTDGVIDEDNFEEYIRQAEEALKEDNINELKKDDHNEEIKENGDYSENSNIKSVSVEESAEKIKKHKLKKKNKKKLKKKNSNVELGSIEEVEEEDADMLESEELSMINSNLDEDEGLGMENKNSIKDDVSNMNENDNLNHKVITQSKYDNIINCFPQEAFINNSTKTLDSTGSRYLCWNMIGSVVIREDGKNKTVECHFSNIANKLKVVFTEEINISLGALNNIGLVVASKPEEQDIDKYENETKCNYSELIFKPVNQESTYKEWRVKFKEHESIDNIAIGIDWISVYTDTNYIYIFSLSGILKFIFSSSQNVICMAGFENILTYVYYSGLPLLGIQNLRFKMIDVNNKYNEIYDGPLSLTAYSSLEWFGFSEEGMLYSIDSEKILRYFKLSMSKTWIPMLNLDEIYLLSGFWVIGIEQGEIYGVEVKDSTSEPTVYPRCSFTTHKITSLRDLLNKQILNQDSNNDEITNMLNIEYDEWRQTKYSHLKNIRHARQGDYYYSESIKSEEDINLLKKNHDKAILQIMKDMILENKDGKALDYFDFLVLDQSRELSIKLAVKLDNNKLAEEIERKHNNYKTSLALSRVDNDNPIIIRESFREPQEKQGNVLGKLSNLAINVDKIRNQTIEDVEEKVKREIRTQIENDGIEEESKESFYTKKVINNNIKAMFKDNVKKPTNKDLLYDLVGTNPIISEKANKQDKDSIQIGMKRQLPSIVEMNTKK